MGHLASLMGIAVVEKEYSQLVTCDEMTVCQVD